VKNFAMMNIWDEINWFAVQCKPWHEPFGVETVEALGLESFFPQCQRNKKICGKVRRVTEPLFPGYFFARFCPRFSLQSVRYSRGVLRILSAGETPLTVGDEIIEGIRARRNDDGYVPLSEPAWRMGDRVLIEEGPFQGLTGIFQAELDGKDRILLLLEALGQARMVVQRDAVSLEAN
jgi:transcriptional antiterminator RfaH